MADSKISSGLQIIFAIFLGLMVTSFVGVGVYTFYPSPLERVNRDVRTLERQRQQVQGSQALSELSPEARREVEELNQKIDALREANRSSRESWGRTTSVILILFATLAMVISMIRADRLPVISNGILLGGVFTMIYGVGWIISTSSSIGRFLVMTLALVITLALGYMRFVRHRRSMTSGSDTGGGAAELTELERRVEALETRLREAGRALEADR